MTRFVIPDVWKRLNENRHITVIHIIYFAVTCQLDYHHFTFHVFALLLFSTFSLVIKVSQW